MDQYDYSRLEQEVIDSEHQMEQYLREEKENAEKKPKIVFKYKSLERNIDIKRTCDLFKQNAIYMPSYKELNDPLEGLCEILLGGEDLRREAIRSTYRILAFSKNCLLPPMWANYAGNYNGICIGFWTSNTFSGIQEVQYKKKSDSFTSDLDLSIEETLCKKSEYWKPEEEWRLLKETKDLPILASGDPEFLLHFSQSDLACVIWGCKVPWSTRNIIEKSIPGSLPTFDVLPDDSTFQLCIKRCSKNKLFSTEELMTELL